MSLSEPLRPSGPSFEEKPPRSRPPRSRAAPGPQSPAPSSDPPPGPSSEHDYIPLPSSPTRIPSDSGAYEFQPGPSGRLWLGPSGSRDSSLTGANAAPGPGLGFQLRRYSIDFVPPPPAWLQDSPRALQMVLSLAWLSVFAAVFILFRAVSILGAPEDGYRQMFPVETYNDLSKVLLMGTALLWITGLSMSWQRSYRLIARSPPLPLLLLLIVGAADALLSNLPAFQHSLADVGSWGPGMRAGIATLGGAIMILLVLLGREVAAAAPTRAELWLYCVSRAVPLAYLGAGWVVYAAEKGGPWAAFVPHLHHYIIGYVLALFAEPPGPVSDCVLMSGVSLWLQGLGAYGYAEYLSRAKAEGKGPRGAEGVYMRH